MFGKGAETGEAPAGMARMVMKAAAMIHALKWTIAAMAAGLLAACSGAPKAALPPTMETLAEMAEGESLPD